MKIELKKKLSKRYYDIAQKCFDQDKKEKGVDLYSEDWGFVLKNDSEEVVGGITFWVIYEAVYIDDLWIEKAYRGKGYGTQLLEKVWNKFKDKGYDNVNVKTNEFQAPKFYEKCGY